MIETVNESVVKIEPKVVINQITSDLQIQSDWIQTDDTQKDFIKNKPTIPNELADLADDATHRTVTDTEKSYWNGKANINPTETTLNFEELTTAGLYTIDGDVIVDVKNIDGKIYQTIIAIDDNTYQIRIRGGGVWNIREYLDKGIINNYLSEKANIVPTVLPTGTNLDTVIIDGVYSIDSAVIIVRVTGDIINQMQTSDNGSVTYRQSFDAGVTWQPTKGFAFDVDLEYKVDKVAGKQLSTEDYTTAEKNKLAGVFSPAYASIYVDNGNTAQSIPAEVNYTKVTAYATNGVSANCTPDAVNDKITITQAGVYKVNYTASYTVDVNNVTVRGAVFLGGVEQGNIHSGGQTGLQGALRSTACSGFINVVSVPADIDVRVRHDNVNSVNITHVYANLNIERIG